MDNKYLDKKLARIVLTEAEQSDLVDFLRALSGELPAIVAPTPLGMGSGASSAPIRAKMGRERPKPRPENA